MKRKNRFLTAFFILIFCSIQSVFPMTGKVQKVPVKIYSDTKIADGEYLHYVQYTGGDKYSDYYYVTVRTANGSGGFYLKTYINIISGSDKKPCSDYKRWPAFFVVDPETGTEVESTGNLIAEDTGNWVKGGGILYWHYRLDKKDGYAEYVSRSLVNQTTNESKYLLKFDTGFPCTDIWAGMIINRFLDYRSPGIFYTVNPLMKDPLPMKFRTETKEILKVKAGVFKTAKFNIIAGDPFLEGLLGSFTKTSGYWIEDTERRLMIKDEMAGISMELAEISNVNMK